MRLCWLLLGRRLLLVMFGMAQASLKNHKSNELRTVAIASGSSPTPRGPMAPTLYYTRDTPAFTGFHPEPAGRGTKGIIWTCLSTILLSSWSSWHGDAYNPNSSLRTAARESYAEKFMMAFLFPEIGAVLSFDNLFDALQLRKTIRQVGGPDFTNFSLSQAFLFSTRSKLQSSEETQRVGPKELVELVRSGRLSSSDLPTDDEIADKSKRDWTLKSLSIIQTLWFIVSIIARLSRGYPVSLYEDITVVNACCGVIEFACWFHCPQDIRLPFIIKPNIPGASNSLYATKSREPEQELTADREALLVSADATRNEASSEPHVSVTEDMRADRWSKELPISKRPSLIHKKAKRRASFATQAVEFWESSPNSFAIALVVFSVLFSGIHIAAWNCSFPSVAEAWVWRGGSLALTVLGVCPSFIGVDGYTVMHWLSIISLVLYPLVRLTMLVVALMSFRKAPARLYESPSWTQYWPHI
ncbi:LOW QUALITY PROTEIN: hypothetical protein B0H65DRAFT_510733 [Neurospora tetraspora]|uniref:Uncharacterized protein n=1 Tax=Neurospora tetraspora TaxID=94610 RepID=A0AAE0JBK0_9PEZI|nr:LOW QUALITY PROTEIN: hypothetical protein B0H65DRAFT_510733 [Neurospora tetraspora]